MEQQNRQSTQEDKGLIKKYRGGGWMGYNFFMSWYASWPLSTLEFYDDKLVFMIWPKKIELPYEMIDSVESALYFPIIAEGVRIRHHSNNFPFLLFWYPWFGKRKVLDSFAQKGVAVK